MALEFWKNNVEFFTSCISLLAAFIAVIGVASWRQTFVGQRKIKLAQKGLFLFYKAEDAIWEIRTVRKSNDDKPRPNKRSWETYDLSYLADEMLLAQKTYQKHTRLFSSISSMRYEFMSVFGKESLRPFFEHAGAVELLRGEIQHFWGRFDYLERKYGETIPENEIDRAIEDYRWVVEGYESPDDKINKYIVEANDAMEQLAKEANMLVNYKHWIRQFKARFEFQPPFASRNYERSYERKSDSVSD